MSVLRKDCGIFIGTSWRTYKLDVTNIDKGQGL